jgi:hypothetical protein
MMRTGTLGREREDGGPISKGHFRKLSLVSGEQRGDIGRDGGHDLR